MMKYFATYAMLIKFSSVTVNSRSLKTADVSSALKLAPIEPKTTHV